MATPEGFDPLDPRDDTDAVAPMRGEWHRVPLRPRRGEPTATTDTGAAGAVTVIGDVTPSASSTDATHFDVPLDEDPQPGGQPVDPAPVTVGGRHPIIPSGLRGWVNIRATTRHAAVVTAYRVGFHVVRGPWYAAQAVFWAVVGVARVAGRQLRWWWVTEQYGLRTTAADSNDPQMWLRLHREVKATRAWRGWVLIAGLVWLAVGGPLLWVNTTTWQHALVAVVVVGWLAHTGRPADRPILSRAVVAARFRRINADIVLRAYYAAGLGRPDRQHQEVTFGSTMSRDGSGSGSQVSIDLPYGKTFDDARNARGAIASGLDVSINQVFLTRDPSSHRRHTLFVADRDPLAVPAGKTPLLDGKVRDIWKPVPFGLDERGRKVTLPLMWTSVLIGAQPRKGKTFAARLLALYAALDPWVRVIIVDGKNSPDWRKFALVAHTMVYGTHPGRDGDPVPLLLEALRGVKKHIQAVNETLSRLPVQACPEGKLTRDLAHDPRHPDLRVWLLVMEEFQVYYELDDKDASTEIAELLSFIMAVGPSAGVIILSSSQKPSGVGAGQNIARLFTRYRDNHAARFALKCGNRVVSEAILGGDAYAEGFDAATLPAGKDYLGVGYLYGLTDATPTVRTYLADHEDAEKILHAARRHRQTTGTLSGMAAGETTTREVRDVLADVRSVIHAGETGVSWARLAERLVEQIPEHYTDVTPAAISAQLRDLRIPSVNIKDAGQTLKGAKTLDIDTAIHRRANP
ncbi:MAG: cell division protein FtsK [Actinobacteria bacterium]|nr:cell division protein FtsK [Actinomycetota bacterium]MBI3688566.1 cell division protein FtsK [Actinomycetota bacterium]